MLISIIVATDQDGVIGRDNRLPWRLPADLRHFKTVTMGKPMIMGRKTWDSIGRALPGRRTIVLTRQPGFEAAGARTARTPEEALALAAPAEEVMVVGGAEIYRLFLPRAGRLYWTEIHAHVGGDARLPPLDPAAWDQVSSELHPADAENPYSMRFKVLERRGAPHA